MMTTLVGFHVGAWEASPFIRLLLHSGPLTGLILSKFVALGLAGLCLRTGRRRVIRWINYWYAGLVVWNLGIILARAA